MLVKLSLSRGAQRQINIRTPSNDAENLITRSSRLGINAGDRSEDFKSAKTFLDLQGNGLVITKKQKRLSSESLSV